MITLSKPKHNYLDNKYDYLILCLYINITPKTQIIRIKNIPNFFLEKVILPGQHHLFEVLSHGRLEINTYENINNILTDIIPCKNIRYFD